MSDRRPRVTVVLATYNRSEVLPFSIGSVVRQSFTDWELLVIGDACTDGSAAVVAGVADSRVRWINLPANTGHQSGPNNEGLRVGRGDLVAYLGHDDLWLPHHLALLVAAADAGADVVCGITELVAAEPGASPRAVPEHNAPFGPDYWHPPTGLVHRRDAGLRCGGWKPQRDLAIPPETELIANLLRAGARAAFVPRLTAVKFPAAWRRDAYRSHNATEQAAWTERLLTEADFEQRELAAIALRRPPGLGIQLRHWARERARLALRAVMPAPAWARFQVYRQRRRIARNRSFRGL